MCIGQYEKGKVKIGQKIAKVFYAHLIFCTGPSKSGGTDGKGGSCPLS